MILRHFLLFIAWLLVSTVLLVLPGSAFPSDDWMSRIYFDKWVHIGMFGTGTFVLCRGLWKAAALDLKKSFLAATFICLGYGIIMEFVQKHFVANRSFDTGDILADAAGAALGLWLSLRVYTKK